MYGLLLTLGLTAAVSAKDHGASYNFEIDANIAVSMGLRFRAFHNEIASHGAFIIANGVSYIDEDEVVQEEDDPNKPPASDQAPEDLTAAIDWVYENAGKGEYRHVDRTRIGVWGQSCGGLEAYGAGALDDRVHHVGIFNSGVVPGSPIPVDVSLIKKPVFYIIGGEGDVAYPNAEVDYAALPEGTPAWKAQHPLGHSGGFGGPDGSIGAVAGKHMLHQGLSADGIMSTPTLITVTGTPVELFPLPTPWPNNPGCADHMYRVGNNDFLKFDPEWARLFDAEASTCFPPQVSQWWYQRDTRLPLTGLGPAFACPEAYKPMLTAVIDDDTKMTYCCPSGFSMLIPQPLTPAYPSQCVSSATPGQVLTMMTYPERVLTSTTVGSETPRIYAVPVNGFNVIRPSETTGSGPTSGTTSDTNRNDPEPTDSAQNEPAEGAKSGEEAEEQGSGSVSRGELPSPPDMSSTVMSASPHEHMGMYVDHSGSGSPPYKAELPSTRRDQWKIANEETIGGEFKI
ncbi:unnamed protein product [Parascedosporium putredinis]|uniref:Uncharacterized protein n=1 Tax=Parascedosporium putredinis TaxID=1442378 RepID=A0A9P1H4Y6_9PEZI|nr:unnamed protein product [Parascedosporium putredinis]CAI7997316.1 unnamed protein product [Parascedosporium putredinis]